MNEISSPNSANLCHVNAPHWVNRAGSCFNEMDYLMQKLQVDTSCTATVPDLPDSSECITDFEAQWYSWGVHFRRSPRQSPPQKILILDSPEGGFPLGKRNMSVHLKQTHVMARIWHTQICPCGWFSCSSWANWWWWMRVMLLTAKSARIPTGLRVSCSDQLTISARAERGLGRNFIVSLPSICLQMGHAAHRTNHWSMQFWWYLAQLPVGHAKSRWKIPTFT